MAEEVTSPQPQNPAVDPELPQPPRRLRVEISDPPVTISPYPPPPAPGGIESREATDVPGTTTFFGANETGTTTFFGDQPTAFEPIGIPIEGGGTGTTQFFGDEAPGRTTLFVDPADDPGTRTPAFNEAGAEIGGTQFFGGPDGVDPATDPGVGGAEDLVAPPVDVTATPDDTTAALAQAQEQGSIQQQYNQPLQTDWRVRLRLLPNATYLYKSSNPGILAPLVPTDGVIFPYLPTVNTNYQAKYDEYQLTHSNFRGFFYRNSLVSDITITGTFTAQNTQEAQYVLAVIHFFRSITKMFYGQDAERGTPPPLVTLSGFGEYQYNNHLCVVSNFTYNLPNTVDYVRVNPNNLGLTLAGRRNSVNSNPFTLSSITNRLASAGLWPGAEPGQQSPGRQDLGYVNQTVDGTSATTYVPTRMDITVTLLPIQTRSQVSQQFSLKKFADGSLLRGGFW